MQQQALKQQDMNNNNRLRCELNERVITVLVWEGVRVLA